MRKLFVLLLAALFALPATASAADNAQSITGLRQQIKELSRRLDEVSGRVDKNEIKRAIDHFNWYGDMRVKADTLHYRNVTFNPGINVDFTDFAAKVNNGTFGDPTNPNSVIGQFMAANPQLATAFQNGQLHGIMPYAFIPKQTYNVDNDVAYTTRLRLSFRAKVWKHVRFSARLTMYKNWGDSTGVKVFDSWNSFTQDGTDGGNTTGDWLRVERAYFAWSNIAGSPFYLSIGRRPSTYGPPTQFRENEPRGGTPDGQLVNFNFDGLTLGYNLGRITGVDGQVVRFCFGQGYESQWGNGEMFPNGVSTRDVNLGGFNVDVLNDGTNFLQLVAFEALDVTDGFKGLIAFPTQYAQFFAPTLNQDLQKFPNFNFVTRVQPTTNIGNISLAGVVFSRKEMNGVNWFLSLGWTRADPNGHAGMFGGLLSDAVYKAQLNQDKTAIIMQPDGATSNTPKNGWSVYTGIQVPAPLGKAGFEYNYGSKYWIPFTQAQDDMIGSKLATRGHVFEGYYIFQINPKMFIKVGGLYYDYTYTNSGSPVGTPQKISDVKSGKAYSLLPVVDTAWDGYASMTVKF